MQMAYGVGEQQTWVGTTGDEAPRARERSRDVSVLTVNDERADYEELSR